jgi:hypothetical protein
MSNESPSDVETAVFFAAEYAEETPHVDESKTTATHQLQPSMEIDYYRKRCLELENENAALKAGNARLQEVNVLPTKEDDAVGDSEWDHTVPPAHAPTLPSFLHKPIMASLLLSYCDFEE